MILLNEIIIVLKTALPDLFISGVFVYVAFQIMKISLRFLKEAELEARIKALLDDALIKTFGERLTVMKFYSHNRKVDFIPYNFMSCQYEVYKDGRKPVNNILSQIPIALYMKFLLKLRDGYVILDTKHPNFKISEVGYDLVAAQGEAKALCFMLKDSESKPIGYVSLKKDENFSKKDIEVISRLTTELSPLAEGWDDRKAKVFSGERKHA